MTTTTCCPRRNKASIIYCVLFFGISFFFSITDPTHVRAEEKQTAEIIAGRIVDLRGGVEVFDPLRQMWQPADIDQRLRVGAGLRTDGSGWAALILADETLMQVNRNSLLILNRVASRAGWIESVSPVGQATSDRNSEYRLKKGELWMRNKNRRPFIRIDTPFVSASIRGTEVNLRLVSENEAHISVLEGKVQAEDAGRSIIISDMEQLQIVAGGPMTRRVLISPKQAVQWTLPVRWLPPLPITADDSTLAGIQEMVRQGDLAAAMEKLEAIKASIAAGPWPWLLSAWTALAMDDADAAKTDLERAMAIGLDTAEGRSAALTIKSLTQQSEFDLQGALKTGRQAMAAAPGYLPAMLQTARLAFAVDRLQEAHNICNQVLARAPQDVQAHNLKGYLQLAEGRTRPALASFEKAAKIDPGLGEPHLGAALGLMRQGRQAQAFEEISIAVLLEPQRSVFLSYWAKMLYEVKRFEEALTILAQAARLDANDPTPLLYQAHILADLNRPAEAIEALNKAIALNDNRAVYRSRFLLDRDLAVKNVDLAKLFQQLGMSEWGGSKALKSMKYDYGNYAAHSFYAQELRYLTGEFSLGAGSEQLKAFLMKPANVNTLSSFNEYTTFFDQPDVSGSATAALGDMGYRHGDMELRGALPEAGMAVQLQWVRDQREGWRGFDHDDYGRVGLNVKWDPGPKDTVSLRMNHRTRATGDLATETRYDTPVDEEYAADWVATDIDLGYHRRFSDVAAATVYVKRQFRDDVTISDTDAFTIAPGHPDLYPGDYEMATDQELCEPYTTIQFLQRFNLGRHQLLLGTYQFWSRREYSGSTDYVYDYFGTPLPVGSTTTATDLGRRQHAYYIGDIWQPAAWLTVEGAVYLDYIENGDSAYDTGWSNSYIHPRFGLHLHPGPNDAIRLAYIQFLDPLLAVYRIDPIETAGCVMPQYYEGARLEQISLGWEHEWRRGFFNFRLFTLRSRYEHELIENDRQIARAYDNRYQGLEFAVNQMIGERFGLATGYAMFEIVADEYDPHAESANQWLWARLTYTHPNGISASVGQTAYITDYDQAAIDDARYGLTNLYLQYEFPQKKGRLRMEISNLFDRHFNGAYLSDAAGWLPERFVALRLELNF